jgi:hypothetical protein
LAVNGVVQTGVRKNVITVPTGPATNFKHAGGWIGFDPTGGTTLHVAVGDGRYVTTAEGGDPENNAQDTSKLLGKLLRIDVGVNGLDFSDPASSYTIPSGNMVINPNSLLTSPPPPSSDVLPEIYAYGLRNPWRASFDRTTGDLYIGDVGQRTREEINFIPAGRINTAELDETPGSLNGINFGWRLREGAIATPGVDSDELRYDTVEPVFDYERTGVSGELPFFGGSVTAGYVYRGPEFPDYGGELDGTFLFADLAARQFGSFRIDPVSHQLSDLRNRTAEVLSSLPEGQAMPRVASFAEDGFGNLYAIDYSAGDIWKITPVPEPHLAIALLAGLALAGLRGVRPRHASRE